MAKIPYINLVADSGHGALALAVSHGNEVAVDILLLQDADIKQIDILGNSMLNIACAGPSVHITWHMLEHFTDLNTCNLAGKTPLQLACAASNTAIVFDLCTREAEVTAQDNKQRTPLMTAILSGNQGTALVLSKWEFVVDTDVLVLTDDNNMNALQYCILFIDQNMVARIRTIELALLSNRQSIPPTRMIYCRSGEEEISIEN